MFKPSFEIMFDDLKPEAQKEFLIWAELEAPEDANFDIFPIAEIPAGD